MGSNVRRAGVLPALRTDNPIGGLVKSERKRGFGEFKPLPIHAVWAFHPLSTQARGRRRFPSLPAF